MIRLLIYIIEIISVLKCIHCVYGEKQKVNMGYLLTVILLMGTMIIANQYSIAIEGTFIMYSILAIYCILTFKRTAKTLIINTVLYMIVQTIIQLVFSGLVMVMYNGNVLIRTLIADCCVMIFCFSILPLLRINKISDLFLRKSIILYLSIGYIFAIIITFLLKLKNSGNVRVGSYLTLLPFIICVYILAKQRNVYQNSYEYEKKELQLYKDDRKEFSGLISKVRSRQHEINNHITAIMSLHYTTGTYEELVKKQSEYCEQLLKDNKYNSLLGLYNSVLPGFLYDKLRYIEEKGIAVECKIMVKDYESYIPDYYVIEMLGILLDNATEALSENDENKQIYFSVIQDETSHNFTIRNPYRYVPYDEIESWFDYEKSSKGQDRGIGLYHLKSICKEWNCYIGCSNVEYSGRNWIEFKIVIGRNR